MTLIPWSSFGKLMEDVVEVIKGPRTARFPDALWACSKRLYRLRPLRFLPAGPPMLLDLSGVTTNELKVVIVRSANSVAAHEVIPANLSGVTFFMPFEVLQEMNHRQMAWPRGMNAVRVTVRNGGMRPEVVRVARAMFGDRDVRPKATFRAAGVVMPFADDSDEDVWAQLRDAIGTS